MSTASISRDARHGANGRRPRMRHDREWLRAVADLAWGAAILTAIVSAPLCLGLFLKWLLGT